MKQHNHRCIVCDTGYSFCNDCNKVASFTPWRKIACSVECYQAHLAYIEYRDISHDAKKFVDMINLCGIDIDKMHEVMRQAYYQGTEEIRVDAMSAGKTVVEVKTFNNQKKAGEGELKPNKTRKK